MPSPVGHSLAGLAIAWMAGAVRSARSINNARLPSLPSIAGLRTNGASRQLLIICAVLAALPDIDVVFGVHRGPTHSVGAVLLVTFCAAIYAAIRRVSAPAAVETSESRGPQRGTRAGVQASACGRHGGGAPCQPREEQRERGWGPASIDMFMATAACSLAYSSHLLLDWLGKDSAPPRGIMALWPWRPTYYVSGADLFTEISRRYWKPDEFIVGNLRSMGWELALLLPIALAAYWCYRKYDVT